VFAICDTSDDPDTVDFPIPSSNDASSAIKLLVGVLADAVVEARGGVTEVAYTKDEGAEATMVDAIRVADIANEQRKAAIRQARKEREERYAKMQAERMARRQAYKAQQEAAKAEEKPAEAEAAAPAAEESK
jgi:small subunit ribosomal protein S2